MIVIIFFILITQTVNIIAQERENYTLYQITAFNPEERAVLYSVHIKNDDIIFLNGVTNEAATPMYVIVEEHCIEEFEVTMNNNDIEYIIIHRTSMLEEFNNMGDLLIADENIQEQGPTLNEKFFDWDEIMEWVEHKIKKNTYISKIRIGETYERRELFVLKVSTGSNRPAVFILGGEQGRDWMTPAVIINYINNMLVYDVDTILMDYYDLYFMPVFNPDGYEYSIKKDRFWDKNRKHFYPEIHCHLYDDELAIGVNIDRNWYYRGPGYTYEAECDSVYMGHKTLTEEEPKALSNFLNTISINLMAFINIKGFVKLITVPYADPNEHANNFALMVEILMHAAAETFTRYNVSYNICRTADCMYNQTGNSPDWVKKKLNIPIVYTLYMKHEDSFLPQLSQIPTLALHFGTIVRESLILANSIYGPLFNCQVQFYASCTIITAIVLLLVSYHVGINI